MSGTLINLIIQIIAGVIGGHAAGATLKNYTLGRIGNTIAGAIGGAVGGQLIQELVPALASTANLDIVPLFGQVVAAGAGGAILTVLSGVTAWMVVPPKST